MLKKHKGSKGSNTSKAECQFYVNLNFDGTVLKCCLCKAATVHDLYMSALKLYHRLIEQMRS